MARGRTNAAQKHYVHPKRWQHSCHEKGVGNHGCGGNFSRSGVLSSEITQARQHCRLCHTLDIKSRGVQRRPSI